MTQIKKNVLFSITLFRSPFKNAKTLKSHESRIPTPSMAILRTTDFHRLWRQFFLKDDLSLSNYSMLLTMEEKDKERSSLKKTCRQGRWKSVVLKIAIEGVGIQFSWHFRVFAIFNGDLNSVMEKSTFFFIWVMCNNFELRPVILVYLTLLPPISQNWHYKLPPSLATTIPLIKWAQYLISFLFISGMSKWPPIGNNSN